MKFNCQQLNRVRPSPGSIMMCIATCVCILLCCYGANVLYLQDGATPLYIACQNGHLPVVERLIAAKADVNRQRKVSSNYII